MKPLTLLIVLAFSSWISMVQLILKYPVTIGGFSGDTTLQGFAISTTGDLVYAAMSSDLTLVNQADTNVVLYYPYAATQWSWARQLTTSQTSLVKISFKADNQRVALLYHSSLLFVLDTLGGFVIRAISNTDLQCSFGCTISYFGNNLILAAIYSTILQQYLGISAFDPESGIPSQSILTFAHGATDTLRSPVLEMTDDNRIMLGVSNEPGSSVLLMLPALVNQVDTVSTFLSNTKWQGLSYTSVSGTKVVFGYLEDLLAISQFVLTRFEIGATAPVAPAYATIYASSSIQYLGIQAKSLNYAHVLLSIPSLFKVYLYTVYMAHPGTFSYQTFPLLVAGSNILFVNGFINRDTTVPSNFNFYVGGNNADALRTALAVPTSSTYSIPFVTSFTQAENWATVPPTYIEITTGTSNCPDNFVVVNSNTAQPFLTVPIPFTDETSVIITSSMSTPPSPAAPNQNCLSVKTFASYPVIQNYYIDDSFQVFLNHLTFTYCASDFTCAYSATVQGTSNADIIFSYIDFTGFTTLQTSNPARDQTAVNIIMVGMLDINLYSGCQFYYIEQQLTVQDVKILPSTITDKVYPLNVGSQSFSLPTFTNDKGLAVDAKLTINYQLLKSDGSAYTTTGFVTGFTSSPLQITINTIDDTLPRVNTMILVASFAYRPSYTVSQPFNIIIEKCFQTVIYPPPQVPRILYQVAMPSLVTPVSGWSNKYGADCGPFHFSMSSTVLGTVALNTLTPSLGVFTNNPAKDGKHSVTITGTLNQAQTTALYQQLSIIIDLIIINPQSTFITPQAIESLSYVLNDTSLKFVIPEFPSSKSYIQAKYQLINQDGTQYDRNLFSFDPILRQLEIYSSSLSSLGTHRMAIKAFFDPLHRYHVTSSFEVNVLHWCTRNVITAPGMMRRSTYIIGDSELTLQIQPWKQSMPQVCEPMTYVARQETGEALPKSIRFDPKNLSNIRLKVFTLSPNEETQYKINIQGSTRIFHESSTITTSILINIKCMPKQLIPMDSQLNFTYFLGSGQQLFIPFQGFSSIPKCKQASQSITYSLVNLDGRQVPTFIKLEESQMRLTVRETSQMIPGDLKLGLIGATENGVRGIIPVAISIVAENSTEELVREAQLLETVVLEVVANSTSQIIYQSKDFAKVTSNSYSMLALDPSLTFVKFLSLTQQLQISPTLDDLGVHQLYLIAERDQRAGNTSNLQASNKVMQLVVIKVLSAVGSKYTEVEAIISSISRSGVVQIDFNQKLKQLNKQIGDINSTDLQLSIVIGRESNIPDESIIHRWVPQNFYVDQPSGAVGRQDGYQGSRLSLQLDFEDSLILSQEVCALALQLISIELSLPASQGIEQVVVQGR